MDATLDPRSSLAGRTVGELNFRERYGIELAGIWREGETVGTELADERLQIGDALLLLGPRDRLQLLSSDSDFLILTPLGQEPPDTRRAPLAAGIMLGVVVTVMLGYAPISIAAVIGGTIMVLTGCLNMEQAYRAIDWRAIFLIAGMLPLGTAMQETGAATYLARPGHGPAWRCRPVACDHGPLHTHRDGDDDHPDRGSGGSDVAHRSVRHGGSGTRSGDGDDGRRDGGLGQLHEPDFTPRQHPGYGPGWLSICRLPQSRRAADDRGVHHGHGAAADSVAAGAGLGDRREARELSLPEPAMPPARLSQAFARTKFAGEIVLVGDEPYLPYQRPPLSKKFLAGEMPPNVCTSSPRVFTTTPRSSFT